MAFSIETRTPYTDLSLPVFGGIVCSDNLIFALRPTCEFSIRNVAGYKPINFKNTMEFNGNIPVTKPDVASSFVFDDIDLITPDATFAFIARVRNPSGIDGNGGLVTATRYNGLNSTFLAFRYEQNNMLIRFGLYAQNKTTGEMMSGSTNIQISESIKDLGYIAVFASIKGDTGIASIYVKSMGLSYSERKSSNYDWGKRAPNGLTNRQKTIEIGGNDEVEIFEILRWDKVLTEYEIEEQYQLSKRLAKSRGIDTSNWA